MKNCPLRARPAGAQGCAKEAYAASARVKAIACSSTAVRSRSDRKSRRGGSRIIRQIDRGILLTQPGRKRDRTNKRVAGGATALIFASAGEYETTSPENVLMHLSGIPSSEECHAAFMRVSQPHSRALSPLQPLHARQRYRQGGKVAPILLMRVPASGKRVIAAIAAAHSAGLSS
jgi:hypothetical protein